MIYELLFPLSTKVDWLSWLNVLRYTPFRAIMAAISAMLMSFVVAPWFIKRLRGKQISQIIREEGPASHFSKRGTPTMGGSLILLSILVPTVLWADVNNVFVVGDGARDRRLRRGGLHRRPAEDLGLEHARPAGALQAARADHRRRLRAGVPVPRHARATAGWVDIRGRLAIPFVAFAKHPIELPILVYLAFAVFVVVAMSNAVNLTDGLDGLGDWPRDHQRRHLHALGVHRRLGAVRASARDLPGRRGHPRDERACRLRRGR